MYCFTASAKTTGLQKHVTLAGTRALCMSTGQGRMSHPTKPASRHKSNISTRQWNQYSPFLENIKTKHVVTSSGVVWDAGLQSLSFPQEFKTWRKSELRSGPWTWEWEWKRIRLTDGLMLDAMQGRYMNLSCVEMQQIWDAGYATRGTHGAVSIGTEEERTGTCCIFQPASSLQKTRRASKKIIVFCCSLQSTRKPG